jgi:hypothetical protein
MTPTPDALSSKLFVMVVAGTLVFLALTGLLMQWKA